ncbi:MAG: cache domain-containing protein [Desulfobacterales bacterium]|nr:cache domain-containing protein [Desulfobacterales bacterium]
MKLRRVFRNLRIRHKLLYSYSTVFILTIALGSFVTYSTVRKNLATNIESELNNATGAMWHMVRTSVSVSIKNHLRAVAEKNLEIVEYVYSRGCRGEMSEAEAKTLAGNLLLSQKIGTTGYIACVNSRGTMVLHPESVWVGVDISRQAFVQEMLAKKEGYIEYDWKNPGESSARPKALYCIYFAPWDWIINVSSYREEFSTLVKVEDFRDSILALRFGKTGYSFVIDMAGNIIVHPTLEGVNIFRQKEMPQAPLRDMLEKKEGKILYPWRNPGESRFRDKLVIFHYIPEVKWIVASSSYLEEFYSPLETISRVIIFTVFASLLLVLPITFFISRSITQPLGALIHRLDRGATGDFSVRLHRDANDEVGRLAQYFNSFMDRLEQYSQSLRQEIADRKQVEADLRVSEERYRSVMEAAPDPIIVYDMDGRVTYLNRAFTNVFGWTLDECLGRKMDHFVPRENWDETRRGLRTITAGNPLSSVETRRYVRDGRLVDVSIRGAVYRDRQGELAGSVIIHRDVTDLKRLEKEVLDIGDRERQNIGQDLHDDLAPHLIGIEGLGKVLNRKLEAAAFDDGGLGEKIVALIKEAITKTRGLARGLCPVYLVDHGLESSLRELAEKTEAVFGLDCNFRCRKSLEVSDNAVATQIFHIVQEAVNNAVRHGRARRIDITMDAVGDAPCLEIADDGIGMAKVAVTDGMGLRIMGFRAKIIDAVLDLRSAEGAGTVVHMTFSNNVTVCR